MLKLIRLFIQIDQSDIITAHILVFLPLMIICHRTLSFDGSNKAFDHSLVSRHVQISIFAQRTRNLTHWDSCR